jgi:hypothetical protein
VASFISIACGERSSERAQHEIVEPRSLAPDAAARKLMEIASGCQLLALAA